MTFLMIIYVTIYICCYVFNLAEFGYGTWTGQAAYFVPACSYHKPISARLLLFKGFQRQITAQIGALPLFLLLPFDREGREDVSDVVFV